MTIRPSSIICLFCVLACTQTAQSFGLRSMSAPQSLRWPAKRIPYTFTDLVDFKPFARSQIEAVLREIERLLTVNGNKCIEFDQKDSYDENYILFVKGGGSHHFLLSSR